MLALAVWHFMLKKYIRYSMGRVVFSEHNLRIIGKLCENNNQIMGIAQKNMLKFRSIIAAPLFHAHTTQVVFFTLLFSHDTPRKVNLPRNDTA